VADRFRLNYLKSTGLERSDFEVSHLPRHTGRVTNSSSPPTEMNIPKTFSSETTLKQAQADLKHPDPKVRIFAIKYYLEKSYPSIPSLFFRRFCLIKTQPPGRRPSVHLLNFEVLSFPPLKKVP